MSTEKLTPESIMDMLSSEVYEIGATGIQKAVSYEEGIQLIQQYADQQKVELQEKCNVFESQRIEAVNLLDLLYGVVYLDYCDAYDIKTQVKLFLESLKPDQ